MSSRLERLAQQSPAATAAPAPSLDADDFSAQAPDGEQAQAQAQPDPGQYAPVDAQGIAEAVVAAMPQPQYAPANRNGRRPPVRVSVPRDPLDKFFSTANTKRLEVYRLVAEPDGMEKPHHAATFNGSDAAGFASLADFVRQRVSNRSKRYGGYRCIAKDASGAAVATEDVYIDAPLDATPATGGADSSGNPIYGAVSDILRTMAGHTDGQQGDLQAQLRGLLSRVNQPGSDNASLYRELADLRVKIAEGGSRQDAGPMSQVVPLLLKRLDEADRRNAVVAPPPVDVERVVERVLAAAETRFQAQISALKPAPDPMAGMAAMLTAMGTIMAAAKGPDVAALIAALRPEPTPPPPPPVAQPDAVDTLIKYAKAREALDGPRQEPPDVLEQITKIATVHTAIKNMGGDASGGNWAGVFGQLLKGGSDMIKEGSKALDKRVELERAAAERAKMQTVATVVQAKAAAGAPVAEVARAGAEAAAAVQQVAGEATPATAPAATPAPEPTATATVADVFQAVGTLGEATTDSERVRRTLMVARVAEAAFPSERAHIRSVFAKAAAGDKAAAMADLREFIAGLVTQAGLAQAAADATLAAFEKHWDTLVARGVFGRPANGAGAAVPAPAAPASNGAMQAAA